MFEDGAFLLTCRPICVRCGALGDRRHARGRLRWGQFGLAVVEDEVVKVHVAPTSRERVDDADVDLFSCVGAEVEDFSAHVFAGDANRGSDDPTGVVFDDFHARFCGVASAADEEACPRLSYLKGNGGERAGGCVGSCFVAANPVIAHMVASFGRLSLLDGITFDRLTFPCVTFSGPVLERAGFKTEVEDFSCGVLGGDGDGVRLQCGRA